MPLVYIIPMLGRDLRYGLVEVKQVVDISRVGCVNSLLVFTTA